MHLGEGFEGWSAGSFTSVDDAVDNLYGIVFSVVNKYVKRATPSIRRPAPWWNRQCARAYARKHAAFKLREKDPVRYRAACTELSFQERKAYAQHRARLTARLSESTNDADWWHEVKKHAGAGGTRSKAAPSVEDLADFFAKKLSLDGEEGDDVPDFTVDSPEDLPRFRIRYQQVRKVLVSLDPKKSVNGLSPRLLKACANELTLPVYKLFRKIAKHDVWPTRWKKGRVTPIWKRKSKSAPKNYRPVTILDNLSLVFERTVDDQFSEFMAAFIPVD